MSVENRLLLKRLATEVNDLLSSYIEIHNRRLREAGSLWSLFRKVDFSRIHKLSEELLEEFKKEEAEINQIRTDFYDKFNSVEREFFNTLVEYLSALHKTAQNLCAISEAQYLRSENKSTLSWDQNKRLEDEYQKSIKDYYSLGEQLNNLYPKLGEGN